MLKNRVSDLIKRFKFNQTQIMSLIRLTTSLEKKYNVFWTQMWEECEKSNHDFVVRLNGDHKRAFCLFCGRKLFETHSFWESSFPQHIYQTGFLERYFKICPEDWPEEKRQLLAEMKAGIGEYLDMASPIRDKLKEYSDNQMLIRAELLEIYEACLAELRLRGEFA